MKSPLARPLLCLAAAASFALPAAAQPMPATMPADASSEMPSTMPATMPGATGGERPDSASQPAALVPNPAYVHWSKYKPGTSVTYKVISTVNGTPTTAILTQTLQSVDAESLKIGTAVKVTMGGQTMDQPPRTVTLPAMVGPAVAAENDPTRTADPNAKVSTEQVEVNGKKVQAKLIETTASRNGMNLKIKAWTSDEIPGQLVKLQTTGTGGAQLSSEMNVESYDVKE